MPLRFTLRQLEYFIAVGEAGSVARAARRANVSSPSISAAIAQLEAAFGVQLFIRRHAHALTLTPAGRELLAEARRVLAGAEGLGALAADIGGEVSGPLAIACLKTFAPLLLPDLRRAFEAAHPAVRATQYELDHADILEGLLRGALDIGLTYDLPLPEGIAFQPLATLDPWVIVAPSHPLAGKPEIVPEDLRGQPMVLLDLPYSADYFLTLFDQIGTPPLIAERTRDMAVLRSLVANGYGYSLINTRTRAEQAPDGKRLAFVPLRGGLRPLQLGLVTTAAPHARRTVAAFAEHCRSSIARDGLPGCLPG
ncbi:LysR family transcriptional regulator [Acidimangrovimonas pyrenivorans]|uniref:LysR family transcriptional regulator n=1 Tax=Acidimangrovimonas pyrenivorans TaxID=2030798 RepID=A0ABV7AM50_9RHOB